MSDVATLNNVRSHTRRGTLALFFLTPVVISAVPRLTWLFLPLIALALSVPVLRRRGEWRQLFQPNTAFIAVLLVAIYIFLNATWAADQGAAFGAAALLLGLALFTLAASTAIAESDELQLRRAALAFTAGAFFGALFVLFELLTKGLITRAVMNAIPLLQPDSAKHVRFSNGEVTKIKYSVFNRNVAIVMFNLWPGLLVLRTIEDGTRRAVLTGLFLLAVAVPVIISKHDSSQVALIGSSLVFILACDMAATGHPRPRSPLVRGLCSRLASQFSRLQGRLTLGALATDLGSGQSYYLGIHIRTRARPPLARHRRRFDACAQNATRGRRATEGLRLAANDRLART